MNDRNDSARGRAGRPGGHSQLHEPAKKLIGRSALRKSYSTLLFVLALSVSITDIAHSQTVIYDIQCTGKFGTQPAKITARGVYRNAGRSIEIKWDGILRVRAAFGVPGGEAIIKVEDYSNLPPYDASPTNGVDSLVYSVRLRGGSRSPTLTSGQRVAAVVL